MAKQETTKRGPGRPKGSGKKKDTTVSAPTPGVEQEEPTVLGAVPVEEPDELDDDTDVEDAEDTDDAGDDEPSMREVVAALGRSVQAIADSTPRRMNYANHKPTSSFNPRGDKHRKLTRKMYQNGFPLDVNKLTDKEIALLNALPAGSFISGLVAVLEVTKGRETKVNIVYDNSNADKRSELKDHFRNFGELLEIITAEAKQR